MTVGNGVGSVSSWTCILYTPVYYNMVSRDFEIGQTAKSFHRYHHLPLTTQKKTFQYARTYYCDGKKAAAATILPYTSVDLYVFKA